VVLAQGVSPSVVGVAGEGEAVRVVAHGPQIPSQSQDEEAGVFVAAVD